MAAEAEEKTEEGTGMRKKWIRIVAVLLVIAGIGIILYPYLCQQLYQYQTEAGQEAFIRKKEKEKYPELLEAMKEYNRNLDENGQEGLQDAWSYQKASFNLEEYGIDDGIIGYLTVPAMDVTLPIYLGATEENMAKGAAHLSETSLPIGSFDGVHINCVLAAHRGYAKAAMFRDIELLHPGDTVQITNLWETLTYQVERMEVISPHDIDAVRISEEEEDMLTLITCHPYGENSQRYCVYCVRTDR